MIVLSCILAHLREIVPIPCLQRQMGKLFNFFCPIACHCNYVWKTDTSHHTCSSAPSKTSSCDTLAHVENKQVVSIKKIFHPTKIIQSMAGYMYHIKNHFSSFRDLENPAKQISSLLSNISHFDSFFIFTTP